MSKRRGFNFIPGIGKQPEKRPICDVCRSEDDVSEPVKGMLDQRRLCGDCRGLLATIRTEESKGNMWWRGTEHEKERAVGRAVERIVEGRHSYQIKDGFKFDRSGSISSCSHNATPFTFSAGSQSYTLYLSAHRERTKTPKVIPTAGLYLDHSWVKGSFFRLDGSKPYKRLKVAFLNWPDFGIVSPQTLREACEWAEFRLKGGERLEIGCVGGHGRTGTTAASLMVYMGWSASEAVSNIRKNYCNKAIETEAQKKLVLEMEKWRRLT